MTAIEYDPKRHCGAKNQAGTPCRRSKGSGTNHKGSGSCKWHFGNTPTGKQHAKTEAAEAAVAKLGIPRGTGDPFALLAKTVQHADGFLEAASQVLQDASSEDKERAAATAIDLAASISIYEQAIRAAARTAKAAVDADVADRLAALDERAASLLMTFVAELLERAVPKSRRLEISTWAAGRMAELAQEYERPGALH